MFITKKVTVLLTTLLVFLSCSLTERRTSAEDQGVFSTRAMVVTAHPLASQVGKQILEAGGNAIDAAIATQFALAVVYPRAGNIGGGGFMVIRMADGSTNTLDYREIAPANAHRDMFLDDNGEVIENLSVLGHLAAGVPGVVDGMVKAHKAYGSLPWATLVQPAVLLALQGFALTNRDVRALNELEDSFAEVNTVFPDYLFQDWQPDDSIQLLDLTGTLTRIRDEGRAGFYNGLTAKLIIEEMNRGGGLISQKDLDSYEAQWRPALTGDYRGHKIITMPPTSAGGITLLQLLESVEPYQLKKMKHNSAKYVHLLVEAERRAYADRAKFLGDPDFVDIPVEELTSTAYLSKRMSSFDKKRATPSDSVQHGQPVYESDQTTHFSIIDEDGNAVAVTTTINGTFGSRVVVGHAGFILNNEMDDFSIKQGVANMFGLTGGEANAIEPGKRMLSSMTPTIVEKENKVLFVTGSPGGSRIITAVLQSILNVIDFEMGAQEAVNAPRFHSQWKPDVIRIEDQAISSKDSIKLVEMGHRFIPGAPMGAVDAIKVYTDGRLEGGADPRREDDTAIGY